jgi:tetratricopeptide (TPR) repeat protein
MDRTPASPTDLLPRGRPSDDAELDLEGRRAMFDVLARLTGRTEPVRVGRYELGERLGQGGCGAVFVAHDPQLDRDVAVKVVLPSTAMGPEASERLVREAQALAKLGHPNIVEVFDVGVDTLELGRDGRARRGVYIVMEHIDGPTLGDWQVEPARTTEEIVDAYLAAAVGLAAGHAAGVIHRDFKPANVMRTQEGRIKVLDFGLAREDLSIVSAETTGQDSGTSQRLGSSDSLTRTGTVMGTPRYMAPEQHEAAPATAAADQYALCVALWEALTGAPAFPGPTMAALVDSKRRGAPPRPKTGRLTRSLYAVIARGLDPDPTRRFENMSALAAALRRARRPWRWPPAAAIAAVAAVSVTVAVASAGSPEQAPLPALCTAEDPPWLEAGFDGGDTVWPPGTRARLERFAARWVDARATACDASRDTPAPQREAAAACVQRSRDVFDQAREQLLVPEGASRAKRQLWGMPAPARCLEDEPADFFARTPQQEAEIDAIQARMRQLMQQPSDPAEVVAFVTASLTTVDALHDHGIATGLLTLQARVTHQTGDYEGAAQLDINAALRCEAADDALLAAEHLTAAAASLTSAGAPPPEVDRLVDKAIEMVTAAGEPTGLAVELLAARAYVASSRGDFDQALGLASSALRLAEKDASPGVRDSMARALDMAATAHINLGEPYLALPLLQRALALNTSDDHYSKEKRAFTQRSIAFAAFQSGQLEEAEKASQAALNLLAEIYAPDHPGLLWDVAFHGFLLTELGEFDRGLQEMERARRSMLQAPRAPELASVLGNLVTVWVSAGRLEEAERDGKDAIERFSEQFGPESPQVAAVYQTLAEGRLDQGDIAGAKKALAAAQAAMAKFPGPDPGATLVSARIHVATHEWDEARRELEQVLATIGPGQLDASSIGGRGTAFALLARIYADEGDLATARTLAAFADPLLARGGQVHRRRRTDLAAWL